MKYFLALFIIVILPAELLASCITYDNIEFCEGDRVITHRYIIGEIAEVSEDDRVIISYDIPYYKNQEFDVLYLSKSIDCLEGARIGTKVVTGFNDSATVVEIFSNGKAIIDYERKHMDDSVASLKSLSYKKTTCDNSFL